MLADGNDVISLDMVMNDMQTLAEDINLNGNGYGFIMDKNGLVVTHFDVNERGNNYAEDEELLNSNMSNVVKRIMQEKRRKKNMVTIG